MRLRLAALLVAVPCLTAISAAADSPALDDARKLTSKAIVEYNVGHFDQALDLYAKAYERYPKPALLFDIGQCHRLLGHFERAIFFYQGYLRGTPEAPNRALVEKFIAESQQQLDAQHAAGPAPLPPASTPAPPSTSASTPTSPSPPDQPPPSSPDSTAPASAPANGWTPLRIAGLATAGVGVVLLGAAIVEGLQASSDSNQVAQISSQHGTWSPQAQSEYDSGKSAASTANVLTATGLIVLAGGAVMTWYLWPKAPSTTAAVAPLPGGASMSLVTRF
jgi:tetratricopeptide (TPR) repeat protein